MIADKDDSALGFGQWNEEIQWICARCLIYDHRVVAIATFQLSEFPSRRLLAGRSKNRCV